MSAIVTVRNKHESFQKIKLQYDGMKKKGEVNEYHGISKRNRTSLQYTIMKSDRGSS